MENFTIRRRNRLRHHYTITSNVLLYGYHHVSDGAKQTYQVVDSMDWADSAGERKGYAYPPLVRIAIARGLEKRTIRRHIAELETVKLMTRDERPGRPSLLIIEGPSKEETQRYLKRFAGGREDTIVPPTPDKNVRTYKKDEEEEEQNLVNGKKDALEIKHATSLPKAKRDYYANEILSVLHDEKSLGYYRKVAGLVEPARIFELLSIVNQLSREGKITKSKAAAFTYMMQKALKAEKEPNGW